MPQPRTGYVRVEPPRKLPPDLPEEPAVEELPEPTDEQLENFMLAMGFPLLIEGLRPPYYRESMLNLHRLAQKALYGDTQAATTLAALKERFGR